MAWVGWFLLGIAAGSLGWRGARIWADAARHGSPLWQRAWWALRGALVPSGYWWQARLAHLSSREQESLLARELARLGLTAADGQRCPLSGSEVPHAWTLGPDGRISVGTGPIRCPRCDFRLDSCRHCDHFLPGAPRSWFSAPSFGQDMSFGRCGYYREMQPVDQAAAPDVARQLKSRGIDQIRAPIPIVDSYVPPDYCRAFKANRQRLQANGVHWPDARRVGLIRLQSNRNTETGS